MKYKGNQLLQCTLYHRYCTVPVDFLPDFVCPPHDIHPLPDCTFYNTPFGCASRKPWISCGGQTKSGKKSTGTVQCLWYNVHYNNCFLLYFIRSFRNCGNIFQCPFRENTRIKTKDQEFMLTRRRVTLQINSLLAMVE